MDERDFPFLSRSTGGVHWKVYPLSCDFASGREILMSSKNCFLWTWSWCGKVRIFFRVLILISNLVLLGLSEAFADSFARDEKLWSFEIIRGGFDSHKIKLEIILRRMIRQILFFNFMNINHYKKWIVAFRKFSNAKIWRNLFF